MLRLRPNQNVMRGGIIKSKVANEDTPENSDVTLRSGEVAQNVDLPAASIVVGKWLLYNENAASAYGARPDWDVYEADFVEKWLSVLGG